nr:hypothetical protein [Tanacetum cinerariifolium]
MIAILEKYEHNIDFHQIVDFIKASQIRYALTINPTVYVSHIRQFWSTARIETMDAETNIFATVDGKPMTISDSSIRRNLKLNDEAGIRSLPDAELFENLALMGEGSGTPTEPHHTPSPEAQQSPHTAPSSPLLPPATTERIPTSTPTEIPTLRQYSRRARIAQSSALPTATDEPTSLLRDDSQGEAFPTVSGLKAGQDRENIIKTSALPYDLPPRVTSLATDEGSMQHQLQELTDLCTHLQRQQTEMALKINAQDLEISNLMARIKFLKDKDGGGTEPSGEDATTKGRSLETEEEAVVSVPPAAKVSTVGIPTDSGLVPTFSPIFTTASVVTPYSRRKGKEKMVESNKTKKKKLQEQIDVQVAREMKEQMAREDQRRNKQIARDAEIARIHAEEELQMLIDGLDRNNEIISKYLQEYEQFAADLSIGEKIDMINELVKYQDHYAKVLKYQSQQSKPLSKKQQREFYMLVLKSHSGWKTKHFKGERMKRKGLMLEQESAKKMKTSEEVSEEDLKEIMQLVSVEEHFDREDLNQLWTLVKETLSIRQATSDKEKEVWVELKRDQEIFMLVEKDYPLRKGLAIVMISNKLQGRIVGNKMLKSFPLPVMKFLLPEYFPIASEEMFPLLSLRDAPAKEVCTADEVKINYGQRHINNSQRRVLVILGRCPMIVPII